VPYDDEITPAQAIGDGTGITAGDTYYHCSDAAGKSINSSPVSGPGTPTPAPTQSSQALAG